MFKSDFYVQQVQDGVVPLETLTATKDRYEGGNSICTAAITLHKETPLGRVMLERYTSICEAIQILSAQPGQE